ncbi:MAG: hypothetical protein CFE21_14310 [Bacteroidetes bacterium B1(2017)]|nr:MAG: hypothetical protein CFE21_14310 [Bacteroidetes bacterium B1(2017)]
MKKQILGVLLSISIGYAFAQKSDAGLSYEAKTIVSPKGATVNLMELPSLPEAHIITIKAAPSPLNDFQAKKQALDAQRALATKGAVFNKKAPAIAPSVTRSFNGNVTQGTPNDNDFCIGNNGMMISCVNTNLNIYNDTGKMVTGKTLQVLGQALGTLNRTYDPRTIYDPVADRFIVVFLQGSSSVDTRIIVAFSTSNDPSKTWNLYQLPGNITGDSSWSDYPIISLSNDELFITVNRLKDNTFWKNGFLESYIWQVDKTKGYSGDSLPQKIYNNIKYNGKAVWSICPAKGGSKLYGPEMYFLSQRPSDLDNDTVFVHYITNTIKSGKASLGMRVLKNPVHYGLQPNAIQPNGMKLQTNDSRVLSAMYENGVISYCGNTIDPTLFSPSIYFGRIHNIWTATPRLEGTIISSDTLDFGYPSIAYVGSGANGDHSSMITFSHVSSKQFPGTTVVYVDRNFNVSGPVFVKKGEGNIRVIGDTVERWGDYTGIQRKYNELGVAWLNGSWGTVGSQNRTWIGRVQTNDPLSGVEASVSEHAPIKVYPNPSSEILHFEFELTQKKMLRVELSSMDGKLHEVITKDWAKAGLNQLQLDTREIPEGLYFVNLSTDEGVLFTFKFVVQH